MLYAAIDIHKHAFQAAVLDPETGVVGRWRRWPLKRRPAGAGSGASWSEATSRCGWLSRCKREPCSAAAAARRPTGSTRAGWHGCWRKSRTRHPGHVQMRPMSLTVVNPATEETIAQLEPAGVE